MSIFNPEQFLQSQVTGALDVRRIQVATGEYTAQLTLGKRSIRQFQAKETKETYTVLEPLWEILDEGVKAATKNEHPMVPQDSIFLELTEDGMAIATGPQKNIQLGRLRAAVNMNQPDRPFCISMMNGSMAKVKVGQKPNPNDPENPLSVVTSVAKL